MKKNKVRLSLQEPMEVRSENQDKDALAVNVYLEKDETSKYAVKRPGIALQGDALGIPVDIGKGIFVWPYVPWPSGGGPVIVPIQDGDDPLHPPIYVETEVLDTAYIVDIYDVL